MFISTVLVFLNILLIEIVFSIDFAVLNGYHSNSKYSSNFSILKNILKN